MGPEDAGSVSLQRFRQAEGLSGLRVGGAVGLWGLPHPPLTMQRGTDQRGILLELPQLLCYSGATGLGI